MIYKFLVQLSKYRIFNFIEKQFFKFNSEYFLKLRDGHDWIDYCIESLLS
jgi:hypothetical protein